MEGVPVMDKGAIKFGALLGEGAFGTVKLAQVDLDGADTGDCDVNDGSAWHAWKETT